MSCHPQDQPLKEWIPYRDEYLSELLRLEGRGDVEKDECPWCGEPSEDEDGEHVSFYRCMQCFGEDLMCKTCCVKRHEANPLHVIEKWNGYLFEEVSLKSLGLVVYLGSHKCGEVCNQPRMLGSFTVIHVNGLHDICLAYCNRDKFRAGEWRQQLMRRQWYPATHIDPHTCATFEVLNHFHIMTLQGKVNTYNYYNGLEKLRNNANLKKTKDRFKAFMRVMRQWRHLKMLKHAGRGNDATRPVEATTNGELGIPCIACPWVGVNLPPNWQDAALAEKYKYFLFLAIDACFRLKHRMVSSEAQDPALGSGWSYMVEDKPFRAYLLSITDQDEMCTCSGLAALQQANTKFSRGYATTGVGVGVCARHEFVQRNGTVDLQKGERYANMDYTWASSLHHHDHHLTKVQSYDIVCQWCKKLVDRLKDLPPLVRLNLVLHVIFFVIPKLHIYGHQILCQLTYSLNWLKGAGRTDGEGVEQPWAHMGPVATSTRDMGPGSRHDTLDDHWNHWNFVKMIGLGPLLLRHLLTAIYERQIHMKALKEFSESQGEVTKEWMGWINDWEDELSLLPDQRTKPNPFEMLESGLTEAEIKLELTTLEAEQERAGIPPIHNVSPTSFISQGLDIEEQQQILKLDLKANCFDTTLQKTALIQQCTKILRAIGKFRSVQATYMPGALQFLAKSPSSVSTANTDAPGASSTSVELPEDIPLCLPSALPEAYHVEGCRPALFEIEQKLREGQLRNSLNQLRNHLHMKLRLLTYRTMNVAHQGAVTRSKAIFNRNQKQIDHCTSKYQTAWVAMGKLVGEDRLKWRKLEKGDEPTLAERIKDVRTRGGEGTREVSWIWKEGGTGEAVDDATVEEIICVEWCKTYARAMRWEEEVSLVKEEMHRCLVSLEHNAIQWDNRREYEGPMARGSAEWKEEWTSLGSYVGPFSVGTDSFHKEGIRAYAYSQAALYRSLASRFRRLWSGLGEKEREIEEGVDISQVI
ncbi:hypothetical protein K435DRAFT_703408 [Dendrothele bispora CBS 962.96]|uniref:CxC2-like cysteine cluster KDZ transposase-associated domain-containing protein n=1 Tax=Dendrothele bispora (strain CBS 962.96) TaxID=1314807 RepID=A0A4S8KN80_DENBC|nr:hypothetical protein K435DRAFT_703408 [Dendrothele bispora CBS 962.96]